VVDVEHRALRAFKHDAAAFVDGFVQQVGRVGDEGRNLLGGVRVLVVHFGRVERLGAEERIGDGVLLVAGVFDVRLEQVRVEQIDDAEAVAGHLVFVSGSDAAAGGTDLLAAGGAFRGEPEAVPYGASKAGLNQMSQSLAQALAPHNIFVGVVAPGFVHTDMAAALLDGPGGDAIRRQSPLGRVATPEEIAEAVVRLAADGMMAATGCILDVNGASYLRS